MVWNQPISSSVLLHTTLSIDLLQQQSTVVPVANSYVHGVFCSDDQSSALHNFKSHPYINEQQLIQSEIKLHNRLSRKIRHSYLLFTELLTEIFCKRILDSPNLNMQNSPVYLGFCASTELHYAVLTTVLFNIPSIKVLLLGTRN